MIRGWPPIVMGIPIYGGTHSLKPWPHGVWGGINREYDI